MINAVEKLSSSGHLMIKWPFLMPQADDVLGQTIVYLAKILSICRHLLHREWAFKFRFCQSHGRQVWAISRSMMILQNHCRFYAVWLKPRLAEYFAQGKSFIRRLKMAIVQTAINLARNSAMI